MSPDATASFPWDAVMVLGLGRLRLDARTFWALSVHEFIAMLGGRQQAAIAPARSELERMMALWPDGSGAFQG